MQKFQNKTMESIMNSAKKVNSVMNAIDSMRNGSTWWERTQGIRNLF